MPRPASDSEKFDMRVPRAELADWRRRAAALSISVAELIRLKMRHGDEPREVDRPNVPKPLAPSRSLPMPPTLRDRIHAEVRAKARPLSRQQVEPRFKASAKVKP